MTRIFPAAALLITTLACAAGCESQYVLEGRVVEGAYGDAIVVDADDPRLAGPPIEYAALQLTLDPRSLGRENIGRTVSGQDGTFSLPLDDVFGAGFLEHEVRLISRAEKYQSAEGFFILPSSSKRILVIMAKGKDTRPAEDNPYQRAIEDADRMGR